MILIMLFLAHLFLQRLIIRYIKRYVGWIVHFSVTSSCSQYTYFWQHPYHIHTYP